MKKDSVFARLIRFTKPHGFFLLAALVSALLGVTLSLLVPVLVGRGVDQLLGPGAVDFPALARILVALGAAVLASALFQWLVSLCTNRVAYRTIQDIRVAAFDRLSRVPLKYMDGHAHGDIMARVVTDVDQISDGLIQGFTQLFTGVVTILGTIGFMLSINYQIALVVVLVTPLSLFVAAFIGKRTHRYFAQQSATRGELGGYIEELVGNQKVVKTFHYEQRAQAAFEAINARLYDCGVKAQFYSSLTNPCTRFVNAVVYAAVGIFGAVLCVTGGLSIGQLTSFLSYANQYTKPFNEITGVVTELQTALAAAKRVFALMDEPPERSDADLPALTQCDGSVTLSDVSFSYREDVPLIEHLNLAAQPGQRIAIVGPTGCGKTTIINLLMRFYDVQRGEIQLSGTPITSITRASLRRQYGMVLQESWLFSGTVRENIAYGRPEATEPEIIQAAKLAHAHGFIMRLEHGYDTLITEDGGNISQGQKQLLCIARIMLTHPPMLILDEATSSIDTRTELRVQQAFDTMMRGRTSFVVAHRLSTIRQADVILVMNSGRIVEQGNHQQLLARGGFYAQLYNSQFEPTESGEG